MVTAMAGVWPRPPGTPKVADAGLEHLKGLTTLQTLHLSHTALLTQEWNT